MLDKLVHYDFIKNKMRSLYIFIILIEFFVFNEKWAFFFAIIFLMCLLNIGEIVYK